MSIENDIYEETGLTGGLIERLNSKHLKVPLKYKRLSEEFILTVAMIIFSVLMFYGSDYIGDHFGKGFIAFFMFVAGVLGSLVSFSMVGVLFTDSDTHFLAVRKKYVSIGKLLSTYIKYSELFENPEHAKEYAMDIDVLRDIVKGNIKPRHIKKLSPTAFYHYKTLTYMYMNGMLRKKPHIDEVRSFDFKGAFS